MKRQYCLRVTNHNISLPNELYTIVINYMINERKALLRFGLTCKSAYKSVNLNLKLWASITVKLQDWYFQRMSIPIQLGPPVVRDVPTTGYFNFKLIEGHARGKVCRGSMWYLKRPEFPGTWPNLDLTQPTIQFNDDELTRVAEFSKCQTRVQFMNKCMYCGNNVNILPVWGLRGKVCTLCLKTNLISSAVLYYEYGINFVDIMDRIAGRVYYYRYSDELGSSYIFSYNKIDHTLPHHELKKLVFFWVPHLKQVIDMELCRCQFREKCAAIRLIQARIKLVILKITIMSRNSFRLFRQRFDFFLSAKRMTLPTQRFYTARVYSDKDVHSAKRWISSAARKIKNLSELELKSMRTVQRSFLSFRGRIVLCNVCCPDDALDVLKMHELDRIRDVVQFKLPLCNSNLFFKWLDMIPAPAIKIESI